MITIKHQDHLFCCLQRFNLVLKHVSIRLSVYLNVNNLSTVTFTAQFSLLNNKNSLLIETIKMANCLKLSIHPSIIHRRGLEPVPAVFGWEAGYTLDKCPAHYRANKHPLTLSLAAKVNIESPICLAHKCMSSPTMTRWQHPNSTAKTQGPFFCKQISKMLTLTVIISWK